MPLPVTFRESIAASDRPLIGMWVSSGSPLVAEICAGGGLDWLLIDMEHGPNQLESVLAQLQAVGAYSATPVVRAPGLLPVMIKQILDLGAQNLLMPMIDTPCEASAVRRIRGHLLTDRSLPRTQVTTRGYWSTGETNHPDHDVGED
jgi:4-hydroxy-2-oxoheptanedioate aldolase